MQETTLKSRIHSIFPDVRADLEHLITYPSVAFPGFPSEPVQGMAAAAADLLHRSGCPRVRSVPIPDGYPAIYGECPAPPGAPTVLFYAHYDVQPAPRAQGWSTDPWTPVVRDGRLYGRGAADNKNGIVTHAAAIRAFDGAPPVGVKIVIEGEEESTSNLEKYVREDPDLFACDAFVIADMGNLAVGEPAMTTSLRGEVSCTVTVRTLDHAVHSGQFGGPAPDALAVLVRILAALHDASGNVAVPGLASYEWRGMAFPENLYRCTSGLLTGVDLIGSGPIGSRLWSRPAISVVGIDAPSVAEASNILVPAARARISMRIAPSADGDHELGILMDFLSQHVPWHAAVKVEKFHASSGFVCPAGGPIAAAAETAMERAFGKPVRAIGAGGSIPLVRTLHEAVPDAEFVLWGSEDMTVSSIHGPNESVDLADLERMCLAEALLLQLLGESR